MKKPHFDFDTLIDRTQTQSDKWAKYPEHVIPMWVADMDFDSPECIKTALNNRINQGVFGYTHASKSLNNAILNHLVHRYHWSISPAALSHLPGLVCALHLAVRAFSNEGDGIVVPGPVYYHLNRAPQLAKRQLITVDMTIQQDRWVPDFTQLEKACAQANAKMILLCNPHNPGGTVYTREELTQIHTLAEKYNLLVVSDEIHCDLIFDGLQHIPFASLNDDAAKRTITLMAPSKTFNIAGLGYAFAIIENAKLRQTFNDAKSGLIPYPNMLGLVAATAAYQEGQQWHQALLNYLTKNRNFLQQWLEKTPFSMQKLEATYLAWIDVSALDVDNPHHFFLEAGVGVSDGKEFGNSAFIRLNFGCPMRQLEQAIERLEVALKKNRDL
ncbi:MalY/PatB family protein [Marinomonas spartinae]|uniref:MalY/PatB family protein n=1 Tax=Marinomonas spartinae TaxID=1792290 RepID=UPI0018F1450F|nr:PatB family C-S lyase [Marinomonas spartinae]MBJ7552820.1 PatB family C-S lyase [Marinomonas spartinae]